MGHPFYPNTVVVQKALLASAIVEFPALSVLSIANTDHSRIYKAGRRNRWAVFWDLVRLRLKPLPCCQTPDAVKKCISGLAPEHQKVVLLQYNTDELVTELEGRELTDSQLGRLMPKTLRKLAAVSDEVNALVEAEQQCRETAERQRREAEQRYHEAELRCREVEQRYREAEHQCRVAKLRYQRDLALQLVNHQKDLLEEEKARTKYLAGIINHGNFQISPEQLAKEIRRAKDEETRIIKEPEAIEVAHELEEVVEVADHKIVEETVSS